MAQPPWLALDAPLIYGSAAPVDFHPNLSFNQESVDTAKTFRTTLALTNASQNEGEGIGRVGPCGVPVGPPRRWIFSLESLKLTEYGRQPEERGSA
ncbi:conserved hypothetical protein [Culex quinquefasciatus]|uniref:Uncharacterized protein n=1 Tax=Culex quinquefasciatus TaxID=7176 RepID=B0WZQ3_CULQU|nr:conserved hypothetical protein [Culex quinquefasciatus]|eukprot:XP_001862875.1 conserved hypothetical protein [Culex quinquefasciatus]